MVIQLLPAAGWGYLAPYRCAWLSLFFSRLTGNPHSEEVAAWAGDGRKNRRVRWPPLLKGVDAGWSYVTQPAGLWVTGGEESLNTTAAWSASSCSCAGLPVVCVEGPLPICGMEHTYSQPFGTSGCDG